MTKENAGKHKVFSLGLLLMLVVLLLLHARYVYAPCDDAYIHLVYVKNLFKGNGLTYNGKYVQGFSSIFWPWLVAGVHTFKDNLPMAGDIASFISAIFSITASYILGRRFGLGVLQAIIPSLVLVSVGDFAFYAGNGLETLLFSTLVLLSASYLWTDKPADVLSQKIPLVLLFLMVLVRYEGILIALIIVGWLTYSGKNWLLGSRFLMKLLFLLLPVFVTIKCYYGYWLPATYYAKSGAGLANAHYGITYTFRFAKHYIPLVFALLLCFVMRWKELGRPAIPLLLIFSVWCVQVVLQGGDNMVGFRMYLAILPLACLTIMYGFRHLSLKITGSVAVLISCYMFVSYSFFTVIGGAWNSSVKDHAASWRRDFIDRKKFGLQLKEKLPEGSVVALSASGITPFFSELPTIDMLGLNNIHIALYGEKDRSLPYAHQAGDGKYVLQQSPDVIRLNAPFVSDREILKDAGFKNAYVLCEAMESKRVWVKRDVSHFLGC